MSASTTIEWTDATWNPLVAYRGAKRGWHCEKISPACDHCYAASMNGRSDGLVGIGTGLPYAPDQRPKLRFEIDEKTLLAPLKWRKPRRIFVCSMTDLFGDWHTDEMIDSVFAIMALCPQHTFQVLTKRPERMNQYLGYHDSFDAQELFYRMGALSGDWLHKGFGCDARIENFIDNCHSGDHQEWIGWPLPNVWLGVTAENQARADERIPLLLQTPAKKRFVSIEPMLGPVDLLRLPRVGAHWDWLTGEKAMARESMTTAKLDWVIAGGESGPNARPPHPDWLRSLRDQCRHDSGYHNEHYQLCADQKAPRHATVISRVEVALRLPVPEAGSKNPPPASRSSLMYFFRH